ncbi:MAG: tetraacyldisaccharide 4'-kinase [Proteobacteria bacterium]|nr:tetraacyldisaccharide 4'-kinase [Pseudomonadota bacterium]
MSKQQKLYRIWYHGETIPIRYKILSKIFSLASGFRRLLFKTGIKKTNKIKCPVIIIGNITVGGVGKTPFVIWLVTQLQAQGYKVGVVSRGYGGKRKREPMLVIPQTSAQASGDEAILIAKHTNAPVMVAKNRVKAANKLILDFRVNIIIADDGLQHYALGRDIEIALIDAEYGLGNQQLLPAGPLRELPTRLASVDMVIYKGKKTAEHYFEYQPLLVYALGQTRKQPPIESFRNQKINAIAGIAHPNSFFNMLSAYGLAIVKYPLDDHEVLTAKHFEFDNDNPIFITEKDAIKCADMQLENVWVVVLKLVVPEPTQAQLMNLIEEKIK